MGYFAPWKTATAPGSVTLPQRNYCTSTLPQQLQIQHFSFSSNKHNNNQNDNKQAKNNNAIAGPNNVTFKFCVLKKEVANGRKC